MFSANCTGHMDNHSKIITPNQNTKMLFFLKHSPLPHCSHWNEVMVIIAINFIWKQNKIEKKRSKENSQEDHH